MFQNTQTLQLSQKYYNYFNWLGYFYQAENLVIPLWAGKLAIMCFTTEWAFFFFLENAQGLEEK